MKENVKVAKLIIALGKNPEGISLS